MTLLDLATLLAPVCIGLATGFAIGWGSASDRWRGRCSGKSGDDAPGG
jgi:hypothetical protein